MSRRRWVMMGAVAVVLAGLLARGANAQQEERAHLGMDRVGSYVSYSWVDHARNGWDLGADLDLGSIITPRLRVIIGANYLKADVDRLDAGGAPVAGSFHDFSVKGELRYRFVELGPIGPFVGGAVGPHFLGSNVASAEPAHEFYSGAKVGWEYFGGMDVQLTKSRRVFGYVEARRILVTEVNRTTLRVGAYLKLR